MLTHDTTPPWRERALVAAFLLFTMATLSHFVHDRWYAIYPQSSLSGSPVRIWPPTSNAEYAPNIYRVGAPLFSNLLQAFLRVNLSWALALMDFCFGFAGLYALYRSLMHDVPNGPMQRTYRAALVLGFLAAVSLPLNWVVPWQRPETMMSVCYLGLSTLCLLRSRKNPFWAVAFLLLTVLQAFTRADVAVVFSTAVLMLSLRREWAAELARRQVLVLIGLAALLLAGGVQLYLKYVAFPNATYPPDTPAYQLPYNFSPHNLNAALLVLTPAAAVLLAGVLRRHVWHGTDVLAMVSSGLYLPIWYLVGSTAEARIFVPFLLLLCLPAARIMASLLCQAKPVSNTD